MFPLPTKQHILTGICSQCFKLFLLCLCLLVCQYPQIDSNSKLTLYSRLTSILISQFLLNLRQVDEAGREMEATNLSQFSAPGFCFAAVPASFGEALDYESVGAVGVHGAICKEYEMTSSMLSDELPRSSY